jgi:hypothetical protein
MPYKYFKVKSAPGFQNQKGDNASCRQSRRDGEVIAQLATERAGLRPMR